MRAEHMHKVLCASTALLSLVLPLQANSSVLIPSIKLDRIVNVIPNALSGEFEGNSEPSIAVNPANTNQMVIATFNQPSPTFHPYFYSRNGGQTWPDVRTDLSWGDITLAWSPGGNLYASRLTGGDPGPPPVPHSIDVVFAPLPADPPVLTGGPGQPGCGNPVPPGFACSARVPPVGRADQPWIEATRVGNADRVYVGFPEAGRANVWYSTGDPTNNATVWANEVIERRSGAGDQVPVRVAANGDRVYAAFERGGSPSDIVVVRDDSGLMGSNRFQALGAEGTTVAAAVPITTGNLGAERLGSDLSIAVDPNNPNRVTVAYGKVRDNGQTAIVVTESLDGGVHWTQRFETSSDFSAGLPALAINADGTGALLYEALDSNGNLQTHLLSFTETVNPNSPNDLLSFAIQDSTIFSFPNNNPPSGDPYVGDYFDLQAVGSTFYGTFSGSNDLRSAYSPLGVEQGFSPLTNGVALQREFDFADGIFGLLDLAGNPVTPSIDPYFFSITVTPILAAPEPSALALLSTGVLGWVIFVRIRRRPRRGGDQAVAA